MQKKPTLFRVPAYHFLDNLKLDVVAPCAEDLVEFRACLSTEVGQHHVAGYVYEAKDRVEGNVEGNELRVLSQVDSLELVEVAQHDSGEVVVLEVNECEVLAVFNRELSQRVVGEPEVAQHRTSADAEACHVVVACKQSEESGKILKVELRDLVVADIEVLE